MKFVYVLFFLSGLILTFGALTGWTLESANPRVDAVLYAMEREPGHPKAGDRQWAEEIVNALDFAAEQYGLDPWLLVACGDIESKFRPDVLSGKTKGPAGEIGILQCGKDCARACDHFMTDVKGQALCGANWMSKSFDACQDYPKGKHSKEFQGLVMYASGHYCEPPDDTPFAWKARKRIRLRNRLKNRFAFDK